MGMTGIAKMVTQSIRCKSPSPWGSRLGLNKCGEIFSDPTRNVSVEPTLHHQGVMIFRVKDLLNFCLFNQLAPTLWA